MLWYQWTPSDAIPCQFSSELASANARFLSEELFPNLASLTGAHRNTHPILSQWDGSGPGVFVKLNSLAEDAKILVGRPGFGAVVRDLRDERGAMAAWHTLHVAALIERARARSVLRFFDDNSQQNPDFIARLGGKEVPVEAKLLTRSEVEKTFQDQAMRFGKDVNRLLMTTGSSCAVSMLLSDALAWPNAEEALNTIAALGDLGNTWRKYDGWSVRTEPLAQGQRAVYFFAPLHDKDYLRIKRRAGVASGQLRSACSERASGVLMLGLRKHDGALVRALLTKQMEAGRFRAIGSVVLNTHDINFALPRTTTLDFIEAFPNRWAPNPLDADVPLQALGLRHEGFELAEEASRPAYVYGLAESDSGIVSIWVPPDRCIQADWPL